MTDLWEDALAQARRERDEAVAEADRLRAHAQELADRLTRYERNGQPEGHGTEHVRHEDPGTSHAAAARQEAAPVITRDTAKHLLLSRFAEAAPEGLTAERAWVGAGLRARSSPWKRVSDLLAHGYLADTGQVGRTTAGAEARILRIAAPGWTALAFLSQHPEAKRYDPRRP